MKKTIIKTVAIIGMIIISFALFAQNPPHPGGGSGPGTGNTPVGGGAPISGGLVIMMLLGAAYGSKRILTNIKLIKMKNINLFLLSVLMISGFGISAQVTVSDDGSTADPSAMFEVKSTDKGMLVPRLSHDQIEGIVNPAHGLLVYNTDSKLFFYFNSVSGEWHNLAIGTGRIIPGGTYTVCGDDVIDDRNGKLYHTAQIGFQCWMRENMDIGTQISSDDDLEDDGELEKYCYDDNSANCATYGGLYQWGEAMQYATEEGSQGICPTGWQIPTHDDWCELLNFVDTYGGFSCDLPSYIYYGDDCGYKLKSASGWYNGGNGDDFFNFTALPAGYLISPWGHLYESTFFWTSSASNPPSEIWATYMIWEEDRVKYASSDNSRGYSVRCIKD